MIEININILAIVSLLLFLPAVESILFSIKSDTNIGNRCKEDSGIPDWGLGPIPQPDSTDLKEYPWVTHVHVLHMTHLDLGFTTDSTFKSICNLYLKDGGLLDSYLNLSIATANKTDVFPYNFITHPWILAEYLDGLTECADKEYQPDANRVKRMLDGIQKGQVSWHAGAFNFLAPLLGKELFLDSLDISKQLSIHLPAGELPPTIASSKDVMGATKSSIPLYVKSNVKALHMGANGQVEGATLPPAFNWRNGENELLCFYYNNACMRNDTVCTAPSCVYGGDVVIGTQLGSPCGIPVALVWLFDLENSYPPTYGGEDQTLQLLFNKPVEMMSLFRAFFVFVVAGKNTKQRYPNAKSIRSSTLNSFYNDFAPYSQCLPNVTKEVGESWISGAGSDPFKLSALRALSRAVIEVDNSTMCSLIGKEELFAYKRRLMKAAEHTFGSSGASYNFHNAANWSNAAFQQEQYLSDSGWNETQAEWTAHRNFLYATQNSSISLQQLVNSTIESVKPQLPSLSNYYQITCKSGLFKYSTILFSLTFNCQTGELISAIEIASGWDFANENQTLASYHYQTYDQQQEQTNMAYNYFWNGIYGNNMEGFSKIECAENNPTECNRKKFALPNSNTIVKSWATNSTLTTINSVIIQFHTKNSSPLISNGGIPEYIYRQFDFSPTSPNISITLIWSNKTLTKLPESSWLSFSPAGLSIPTQTCLGWNMDVQGSLIHPDDIINNGANHLHAVWDSVSYTASNISYKGNSIRGRFDLSIIISTADAALVSPGSNEYLYQPNYVKETVGERSATPIDCSVNGMYFNLHNNIWYTDFLFWYADSMAQFRFNLYLHATKLSKEVEFISSV